ncbi:MAG: hypothetical protein ACKOA1_06660 [Bacteroidota bacterium]
MKKREKEYSLIIILLFFYFIAAGCNKDKESFQQVSGSLRMNVYAKHHSWGVEGLSVYLEDNALQFPGYDTTAYTWKEKTDSLGFTSFNELFPGDYYLYATGYDSIWGDSVIGYMPVSISNQNTIKSTLNIEMYVSE